MSVVEPNGAEMLKSLIASIAATIAVVLVGGYLLLRSGFIPANADATPGPIETWVAKTSLHATLNSEAQKSQNHVATTKGNRITGSDL